MPFARKLNFPADILCLSPGRRMIGGGGTAGGMRPAPRRPIVGERTGHDEAHSKGKKQQCPHGGNIHWSEALVTRLFALKGWMPAHVAAQGLGRSRAFVDGRAKALLGCGLLNGTE